MEWCFLSQLSDVCSGLLTPPGRSGTLLLDSRGQREGVKDQLLAQSCGNYRWWGQFFHYAVGWNTRGNARKGFLLVVYSFSQTG